MTITRVFRVTADLVTSDEELEEMNDYLEVTGAEIVDYYFDYNGDQMFITEHYIGDEYNVSDIVSKMIENMDTLKNVYINKNIQ